MTIENIDIEIIKKKIKNLHLYVLQPDGRVRVTAPKSMKEETIRAFVTSKTPWIRKQQEKLRNQSPLPVLEYVSGEYISLWGKRYELEVVFSNLRNDVEIYKGKVYLQVRETSTKAQREELLNFCYREQMKKEVQPLLEKWHRIIGVEATDWGIKNMKTRWGTCNVNDKRVWLNLQLAKKDPKCLEYIVVHELAHLIVSNHSKAFKDLMERFLPNWKTIKAEL